MSKEAQTTYPIHEILHNRWSPRSFNPEAPELDQLLGLFEAARWAPSANNIQPWSFIVTTPNSPQSRSVLLSTMSERNQLWASQVPVLVLAVAQTEYKPGTKNTYAMYDLGQAVAHLSIQATSMGISVHQIGGFDHQTAAEKFALPPAYEPVTILAVGYRAELQQLPEALRDNLEQPRTRKALDEIVFDGEWQQKFAQVSVQ